MVSEAKKARDKRYRAKLRYECFKHYGDSCYECGEKDFSLLELHHPDGDGNKDRAEKIGYGLRSCGGWNFYLQLKKLGYPEGYKLICIKCHDKKHGRTPKEKSQKCAPGSDPTRTGDVLPF